MSHSTVSAFSRSDSPLTSSNGFAPTSEKKMNGRKVEELPIQEGAGFHQSYFYLIAGCVGIVASALLLFLSKNSSPCQNELNCSIASTGKEILAPELQCEALTQNITATHLAELLQVNSPRRQLKGRIYDLNRRINERENSIDGLEKEKARVIEKFRNLEITRKALSGALKDLRTDIEFQESRLALTNMLVNERKKELQLAKERTSISSRLFNKYKKLHVFN